jgi:hypothetical protein
LILSIFCCCYRRDDGENKKLDGWMDGWLCCFLHDGLGSSVD